jgi:hypothetical protein
LAEETCFGASRQTPGHKAISFSLLVKNIARRLRFNWEIFLLNRTNHKTELVVLVQKESKLNNKLKRREGSAWFNGEIL